MISRLLALICVGTLFCAPAFPQVPAKATVKEQPPAPGPSTPFRLPQRKHYVLSNGMQVNLLQFGTIPKVSIEIDEATGKVDEDAQHVALSAITADLMGEGTSTHSGEEVARLAGGMGGQLWIEPGTYQSMFSLDVLSQNAADAIGLMGDVVEHPAFPAKDLERLRADRLRSRITSLASPDFLVRQKFAQVMYGDQPYGRVLPTEAMLKSYTLADVQGFYAANYGAQRASIYVVGRFDEKAVRKAIEKTFGKWPKGAPAPMPVQVAATGPHFAFVDHPGAAQSNVLYGIQVADVGSPDGIPVQVMNSLLGGPLGSRITANIREQKGYTYSPHSRLSEGYETNIWTEDAAITTAATGPALQEIVKEIKLLQSAPPTATELGRTQRYEDGFFILNNSSRQGVLNTLSFVDFHHLQDDYLTGYAQRVNAVTPEQVQALAKKYLDTNAMTLVVVGDPAMAKPQLSGFAAAATK